MSALRGPVGYAVLAGILILLAFMSVSIVDETKQAVVLRLEKPIGTVNAYKPGEQFGKTGAGLLFRIPFVDRIVWVDKRVLDIDLPNLAVLSTDQTRLEVDAYARFRIVDPYKMVVTAQSEANVTTQLQSLLGSSLRNELGRIPFAALLSPERGAVMEDIQKSLQKLASQYGVEIVDVRIKHADLPSGAPLDSAYARMRTAREQESVTIEAQGRRDAQIIQADAQAQAAKIYADSFNKDPEFYNFFRAMQSYRTTFLTQEGKGSTQIILSPNDAYLKEFSGRK